MEKKGKCVLQFLSINVNLKRETKLASFHFIVVVSVKNLLEF